jgi:single-strand DNA-binding protein
MNEVKNRVQLSGNLGRDPEIRTFDGNKKMARFSIATPEYTTNAMGGKIQQMQWHNAVAWGKTADLVEQQLFKGQQIAIEGRLSSRSYLAKDGTKKYSTDIVVNGFEILDKKK